MNLLVTGGAGYIGSQVAALALKAGHKVSVVDNLYSGFRWLVPEAAEFFENDIGDIDEIKKILRQQEINAVLHFAAHTEVEESVQNPEKYFANNTEKSLRLIQLCEEETVEHFIFSSTAAVYGDAEVVPVKEDSPRVPVNPYGQSKLKVEEGLEELYAKKSALKFVALRYFNVAGADDELTRGQAKENVTTLIDVAARVATGQRQTLSVFGNDYDTEDGTCVRDFIHVFDLAEAHLKALDYLASGGESGFYNCGYGHGYSIRQVVTAFSEVLGEELSHKMDARRPGDIVVSIADNEQIKNKLNWTPQKDNLVEICRSAYEWEKKLLEKKEDLK